MVKRALVGRGQYDVWGSTGGVGFGPACRAQAPLIAGLQADEAAA